MTTAATPDTRRITEHDPALKRLKARTERELSASIQQLVRDLRRGESVGQAQSHFIQRHFVILRNAYTEAHREGQHDYYQGVSRTPDVWATGEPDHMTLQRRMLFYAPSVAKMAHEAARAYEAPPAASQTLTETAATSMTLDEAGLGDWQQSLGARISLQADLTWSGGQDGYVQAGWADSAANPYGALWWDLEPTAQHCEDCPVLAAGSPYDPPWIDGGNALMTTPGDGTTECGAGCRCSLSYGPGGAGNASNMVPQPTTPPDITPATVPGEDVVTQVSPSPSYRRPQAPMSAEDIATLPHVAPPLGDLGRGEQRALDLYREAARQWAIVRGTLPDLPSWWQVLGMGVDPDSHGPLFPAMDTLTPEQRRAIKLLDEAISTWYATSSYRPDLYDLDYSNEY